MPSRSPVLSIVLSLIAETLVSFMVSSCIPITRSLMSQMVGQDEQGNMTRTVHETHYNDVIMGVMASQITSLTIVFSTVYLDTDQRKQQSSTSLAYVRGNHRRPANSPHKWPVTRKMFPFDDVIMSRGEWLRYIQWKLNQNILIFFQ